MLGDAKIEETEPCVTHILEMLDVSPIAYFLTILFAIVAIAGAVGLLKLKPWGRLILEILSWICLILLPLSLIQLYSLFSIATERPSLFIIMMLPIFAAKVVVIIIVIRCLRGDVIRKALESS